MLYMRTKGHDTMSLGMCLGYVVVFKGGIEQNMRVR